MHRVRVVVEGRVQGVGFRWYALRRAEALGVSGAVWNRADGAVEVEAEGARASLEVFAAALGDGPANARVTRVTADWSEGPSRHRGFAVARSRPS